jgi:predicted O-linked N-acetylglucosamine transferase (SPINDLY family)
MDVVVWRYQNAGCDMERVHFLPHQMHHRLLALYSLSTVVLDSYPAGGCTTTREILEMGKVVVTLPARLLGGRWTLAYYRLMGDATLTKLVVANSEEHYIELAVALGTRDDIRREAERRVAKSFPNILARMDSIQAWEDIFLRIAPVKLAEENGTCRPDGHDEL